ncbi:acyltransferase [bacterium]|nr:acyltransferase [bacterium]
MASSLKTKEVFQKPSSASKQADVFFPALNTLRFVAALLVLIHHIEVQKWRCGVQNLGGIMFFHEIGSQGVHIFFVLSSFLLTYLLLTEARQKNDISVRNFYVRRALRIWPLYFLIVAIAFTCEFLSLGFLVPAGKIEHSTAIYLPSALLLFIFMLPNLCIQIYPPITGAAHCWSLGIEEQFYLFWPLLVKNFKSKPVLILGFFGAALILCRFGLPQALQAVAKTIPSYANNLDIASTFLVNTSNEMTVMLAGAAAAIVFFLKKESTSKMACHWIVRLVTIFLIAVNLNWSWPGRDYYLPVLYAVLVLSLTETRIPIISSRFLVYLGTISYGIYMFHPLILSVVSKVGIPYGDSTCNLLLYFCGIPLSILISVISYELMEKKILKLKPGAITGDISKQKNDSLISSN